MDAGPADDDSYEEDLWDKYRITDLEIPRYRGSWEDPPTESKPERLVVLARIGGGNRDEYQDHIDLIEAHPGCIYCEDMKRDCTYLKMKFVVV